MRPLVAVVMEESGPKVTVDPPVTRNPSPTLRFTATPDRLACAAVTVAPVPLLLSWVHVAAGEPQGKVSTEPEFRTRIPVSNPSITVGAAGEPLTRTVLDWSTNKPVP